MFTIHLDYSLMLTYLQAFLILYVVGLIINAFLIIPSMSLHYDVYTYYKKEKELGHDQHYPNGVLDSKLKRYKKETIIDAISLFGSFMTYVILIPLAIYWRIKNKIEKKNKKN